MESSSVFWPDFLILIIIGISVVISFVRGFIKEVISLISWILSAWIGFMLAGPLSSVVAFTKVESINTLVAFLIVFVGLVFLGALVNFLVGRVIRKTPFSVPDRMLGVGFGFLRGFLIVTLMVFFAGLTPMPNDDWWNKSFTITKLENVAEWLRDRLPERIAKQFEYDPQEKKQAEENTESMHNPFDEISTGV